MKGLELKALQPYVASPEEFEKHKSDTIARVADLCDGEPVVTAAAFRQGGAAAGDAIGDLGQRLGGLGLGFLARKGAGKARAHRAGGLPKRMLIAVTARQVFVFDTSYEIAVSNRERERGAPTEAARWDRDTTRFARGESSSMTTLRIEPAGEPPATIVGGSSADDPWSGEVIGTLTG